MTTYRIKLKSQTGREFVREFGSMTERELFKLTLPTLMFPPTVIEEYLADAPEAQPVRARREA